MASPRSGDRIFNSYRSGVWLMGHVREAVSAELDSTCKDDS